MQAILAVTFPFFALVLAGYLATRRGLLPEAAIPGLNTYVLWFALPCMLFRFGAGLPVAQLFNLPLMAIYATCALLLLGATILLTRSARVGLKDAAFGALVAVFPNTGFMGVPLLVALLGTAAAGPVILTVLVDLVLTSSVALAIAQLDGHRGHGWAAFGRAVRGALTNPLPWAIGLGALVSWQQIQLWGPLAKAVGLLGDSASPVALFTIGAVLARAQRVGNETGTPTPLADYLPVAAIKLFIHPLLVLVVGLNAMRLGWPVDRFSVIVLALAAALPSASNVSLLAERYGADNGRIARIILASTALAFLSFSAAVWLLT
ncbi:transporter [beta proteobacterium AAP99]|nr:transporter [beta proteobacterium AAP99]